MKKKGAILSKHEKETTWIILHDHVKYKTIQHEIREKIVDWILKHPHVKNSPISRDTILVLNPETNRKGIISKYLIEISIRELHDDLIKPPPTGLPEVYDINKELLLISESTLRSFIPPKMRAMSPAQRQICGCEIVF